MKYIKQGFKYVAYMALLLLIGRLLFVKISPYFHDYEDEVWQPYQKGDSFVFINDKGDSANWVICQIRNRDSPSDPLLPLAHRKYITIVCVDDPDPWKSHIVKIINKLGKKSAEFKFPSSRSSIYVHLDETPIETLRYNQLEVIQIEKYHKDWEGDPYLQKIYWSSNFGYIKAIYSDGETWELLSFTRDGKCLYQLK